jgi:GGDEF domain-containing protein
MGVLSVQSQSARAWQAPEIDLVNAMAALFGKAMEVESLKVQLWQAQEALELSSAVLEDSAVENPRTGLPSRRYLELWCKSNLALARRRREIITLATWIQPPAAGRKQLLESLAGVLRGMDLVVDLGRDRFLLVLPRTAQPAAVTALARVREILGPVAMGATLWNPLLRPDRDTDSLEPAIRRAQRANPGELEPEVRGPDAGNVAWALLEPSRENLQHGMSSW